MEEHRNRDNTRQSDEDESFTHGNIPHEAMANSSVRRTTDNLAASVDELLSPDPRGANGIDWTT